MHIFSDEVSQIHSVKQISAYFYYPLFYCEHYNKLTRHEKAGFKGHLQQSTDNYSDSGWDFSFTCPIMQCTENSDGVWPTGPLGEMMYPKAPIVPLISAFIFLATSVHNSHASKKSKLFVQNMGKMPYQFSLPICRMMCKYKNYILI